MLGHEASRHWQGGPKRTGCSRWDAGFATMGVEGGAELTRVTENHVETVGSLDRGR